MRELINLVEALDPNSVKGLIQRFGGRKIEFRNLPQIVQQAILTRAAEHLDPDWDKPPKINPKKKFGYVEIPMEDLQQAVLANIKRNDPDAPFETFDDYHKWYVSHGDTPNHTDIWPIELEVTNPEMGFIDDGSHRFHSYVRRGVKVVPAIYAV